MPHIASDRLSEVIASLCTLDLWLRRPLVHVTEGVEPATPPLHGGQIVRSLSEMHCHLFRTGQNTHLTRYIWLPGKVSQPFPIESRHVAELRHCRIKSQKSKRLLRRPNVRGQ